MKAFQVDLKACLGLVVPNQYYPIVVWEIEVGFRVILLCGPRLLLCRPYYEPLLWFMISFCFVLIKMEPCSLKRSFVVSDLDMYLLWSKLELFLDVIKIAKIYKDAILVHHRVFYDYEMMSLC